MRRPMCVIGLTLALTTLAAFLLSPIQAFLLSAAASATGIFVLALRRRRLRVFSVVLFSASIALAGYTLFYVRTITPFVRAQGQTVEVRGLVTEARKGLRANFYTLSATFPGRGELPGANLSLRAFGEMDYVEGDVILCIVRLDEEVAVPGDYGFSKAVFASGQVADAERLEGGYPLRRGLFRLRRRLEDNVYGLLPKDSADLVTTMVLGADNVDADTYAAVNRAGTAHLLSVSGLHLSIVTAMVLQLLERLRLSRRASSLAAVAAALAFSALVGFSGSILRSFLMTAVMLLARAGPRRSDSLSSLGFAVAVISLFFPTWLLGRGFWFSAGSTLGILLLGGRLSDRWTARLTGKGRLHNLFVRVMVGAGAVSVGAYVFTLPLFILFNGWISLVSPMANVLVAPFSAPILAGGILCAAVGGSSPPMRAAAFVTDFCSRMIMGISELCAHFPLAAVSLDQTWMLLALAFIVGAGVVLAACKANRRVIACACALAVLVCGAGAITRAEADRNIVELCTIAECDAAVLLRNGEAVILGTPTGSEVNRLLRYLEFRGVRGIRAVVAADCGEQVSGGLLRLGARFPIDCIVGPNDAYILGQLAQSMTDIPVYSGGYATMDVLGGVKITLSLPGGDILVATADGSLRKSARGLAEYAIIKDTAAREISLFPDGDMVLQGARGYEPVPLGAMLHGEKRFRLRIADDG